VPILDAMQSALQKLSAAITVLTVLSVPSVEAQGSGGLEDVVVIDVLPGWHTEHGTHMAGIRVRLAPGWKTYWRSPGDGGIPPEFDFAASENLKSVRAHWPRPVVFDQNGVRSIGYKDEVVFPLEVTPREAGEPVTLRGSVDLGVCQDVCMPVSVKISAGLVDPGTPDPVIRAALTQVPDRINSTIVCELEPIEDGMQMTARIPVKKARGETAVIELDDRSVWISPSVTERQGDALHATVDMVPPSGQPFAVDRSTVRVTILSDGGAVEIKGCVSG